MWLGLLRFYTEEFPFGERVVCIRRLAPLTKFEKLWNGYGIAIEDPFDLNHNLGSGLSRKSGCMYYKANDKLYCNTYVIFIIILAEIKVLLSQNAAGALYKKVMSQGYSYSCAVNVTCPVIFKRTPVD